MPYVMVVTVENIISTSACWFDRIITVVRFKLRDMSAARVLTRESLRRVCKCVRLDHVSWHMPVPGTW